jgi:hypothetical protein
MLQDTALASAAREWAEVKTLVLGEIQAPVKKEGQVAVHTAALSYFSRLTDATTLAAPWRVATSWSSRPA